MKKKWFTLIEIMIVIVIISILLALTLWISWRRIQILKNKSVQEQFTYTYNSLFSRNLLTNYYNGELYSNMTIHLTGGENKFLYCYKKAKTDWEICDVDNIQWGNYLIKELAFSWSSLTTLTKADIIFNPYVLWCTLSWNNQTWWILNIKMAINDDQDYCVKINANLCKLEKISCE